MKSLLTLLLALTPTPTVVNAPPTPQPVPVAPCTLAWDRVQTAATYKVWCDGALVTSTEATTITVNLPVNRTFKVTLTEVNGFGEESPHSDALPLLPVTPQFSTDLKNWQTGRTFFVKHEGACFFRFSTPVFTAP